MFIPSSAVATDSGAFVFLKGKEGGKPVPYISYRGIKAALDAIGMDTNGSLSGAYNEALVELAAWLRENEF